MCCILSLCVIVYGICVSFFITDIGNLCFLFLNFFLICFTKVNSRFSLFNETPFWVFVHFYNSLIYTLTLSFSSIFFGINFGVIFYLLEMELKKLIFSAFLF